MDQISLGMRTEVSTQMKLRVFHFSIGCSLIMGVSTGRTDVSATEYTAVYLHGNHVYSVRTTHALSRDERFVMLRDPHARSQYIDDRISAATLETLQKTHRAEASAGSFWISWLAFRRFFATLTICLSLIHI